MLHRPFLGPTRVAAFLISVFLLTSLSSCSDSDCGCVEPPSGHRAWLGSRANPRGAPGADPLLEHTYVDIGLGSFPVAHLSIDWGAIENRLGSYTWTELDNHVRQARRSDVSLSVEILVIDNQGRGSLPEDVVGQWLDQVNFRSRFARFCEALVERGGGEITHFWVGREVDVYLAPRDSEVGPFVEMIGDARRRIRKIDPDLPVGTSFAYSEAIEGGWLGLLPAIADSLDRVGLSVYGRDREFEQVLGPAETLARLVSAVDMFPNQTVVVTETSFPSISTVLQLEFAQNVTAYLESAPSQLEGVVWSWLYDPHEREMEPIVQRIFPEDPKRGAAYSAHSKSLGVLTVSGSRTETWLHVSEWNGRVR